MMTMDASRLQEDPIEPSLETALVMVDSASRSQSRRWDLPVKLGKATLSSYILDCRRIG